MRNLNYLAIGGALMLAMSGCFSSSSSPSQDEDDNGGEGPPDDDEGQTLVYERFVATASPSQEVGFDPDVDESMLPGCRAYFQYDGADALHFDVFCHQLHDATMAHIHHGSAKEEGGVTAFLFNDEDGVSFANDRMARGVLMRNDDAIEVDFDELIEDLRNDRAYFNAHTMSNQAGEVRGQIVGTTLDHYQVFPTALSEEQVFLASASPSQEVSFDPELNGTAPRCTASFVHDGMDALDYSVHCTDIEGVTMAHIHEGSAKEEGGVDAFLFDDENGVDVENGILTEGRLERGDDSLEVDFDTVLARLQSDGAYLNVHTLANEMGEVRGQIIASEPAGHSAEHFVAASSPSQEVGFDPEVDEMMPPACATLFRFNGFNHIDFDILCNRITDITMAHIHEGSARENGGVDATLFDDADGQDVDAGRLAWGRLERDELGEEGFDEMLNRMRDDGTYFNAHTETNPDGEVRGQITPFYQPAPTVLPEVGTGELHFLAASTPSQEVDLDPQVGSPAPSCTTRLWFDGEDSIGYTVHCARLTGAVEAHIHEGSAKENGGVLAFLFHSDEPVDSKNGLLAAGVLSRDELGSEDFERLVEMMRTDRAYVNVHSETNPEGEVRGQIIEINLDEPLSF